MIGRAFDLQERAMLTLLMETFAPSECDLERVRNAVEAALFRLADAQFSRFRSFLRFLESPLLVAAMLHRFRRFSQLSRADRERMLLAMSDSRLEMLRGAFQAVKRLCTFMAYATTDERKNNPLWPMIGYPGPRTDNGHAPLPAFVEEIAASEMEADVVVVGSGAGGGVAAATFAEAGKRVIVLEAGRRTDGINFNQLEAEALASLYLDAFMISTDDLGIVIAAGACVGGGTVVNLCSSLPLPPVVAAQWEEASGGICFGASLAPHVQAVRERLGIAPALADNAQNAALVRGCRALGWQVHRMERNASGCRDGCGYCTFGCAYGCKRSTDVTYLRDAAMRGARVFCNVQARRVLIDRGRACGVEAMAGERTVRVRAPIVALAAGALRTPGLLAASGIEHPQLGKNLHLHPSTALTAEFDDPIDPWIGPAQTAFCDELARAEAGYGVTFEMVPAHPGLTAAGMPWRGSVAHARRLRNLRNLAAFAVLTRDRGSGSVGLGERADVRYRVSGFDARHMLSGLAGVAQIAFAAGARRVSTLHSQPVSLTDDQADARGQREFAAKIMERGADPNRLVVFSAHQMGTCRMHRDPRRGVVDGTGAVHGVRGVVVTDASVFPLAAGINPMLPIMAIARRTASMHAAAS